MPINKIHISAAIITLNEQDNIKACLQSLDWVDEVVVVDSESSDQTCKIAKSMGARVISQKFLGHVAQKQLAIDACKYDWVFCIDADERVTPQLKQSIFNLFSQNNQDSLLNGYRVSRKSFHMGRWIMHGGWYPDRNIRLLNRHKGKWAGVDPHDKIQIEGSSGILTGDLEHYVFKNLKHNVDQNNFFSTISADILHQKGAKASLTKLFLKPPGKFIETYLVKKGYKDGVPGFIISVGAAYSIFLKFAKLWELQKKSNKDEP